MREREGHTTSKISIFKVAIDVDLEMSFLEGVLGVSMGLWAL